MKDLTLVVTTMDRPSLLKVFFEYYRSIDFEGQIIVGDASKIPYELSKNSPSNFKIVHLKNEVSQIESLLKLTRMVTTPYSLFCGDDDYLLTKKFNDAFLDLKNFDNDECVLNLNYCALFVDEHHLPVNISFPFFSRDFHIGTSNELQKKSNLVQYARVYRSFMFTVASTTVWERAYKFASQYKSKAISAEIAIGAFLVANHSILLAEDFCMVRLQHPKRFSLPEDNASLGERAKLAIDLLGEEAFSKPLNELFLSGPSVKRLREEAVKSHSMAPNPYMDLKDVLNALRPDVYLNSQLSFIYWGNYSTLRHGLEFAKTKAKKDEKFLLILDNSIDQQVDYDVLHSFEDMVVGTVRLNTFLHYFELDQVELLCSNLEGHHRFISISSVLPLERFLIEKLKPVEVLLYWPHMSNFLHYPKLVRYLRKNKRKPTLWITKKSLKRWLYYLSAYMIGVLDRTLGMNYQTAIMSAELEHGNKLRKNHNKVKPRMVQTPDLKVQTSDLTNRLSRGFDKSNQTIEPKDQKSRGWMLGKLKSEVKKRVSEKTADRIAATLNVLSTFYHKVRVICDLIAGYLTRLIFVLVSIPISLVNYCIKITKLAASKSYERTSSATRLVFRPITFFWELFIFGLLTIFYFLCLGLSRIKTVKDGVYRSDIVTTGLYAPNSYVDSCLRHKFSFLSLYFASRLNIVSSVLYFTISEFRWNMLAHFRYDEVTQIGAFNPFGKLQIFVPSNGEAELLSLIYPKAIVGKAGISFFTMGSRINQPRKQIRVSMAISVGLLPKNKIGSIKFMEEVRTIIQKYDFSEISFRPHPLMKGEEIGWYIDLLGKKMGLKIEIDDRPLDDFLRGTDLLLTSVSGIICEIDERDHPKILILETISKNLFPEVPIIYDLYPLLSRLD